MCRSIFSFSKVDTIQYVCSSSNSISLLVCIHSTPSSSFHYHKPISRLSWKLGTAGIQFPRKRLWQWVDYNTNLFRSSCKMMLNWCSYLYILVCVGFFKQSFIANHIMSTRWMRNDSKWNTKWLRNLMWQHCISCIFGKLHCWSIMIFVLVKFSVISKAEERKWVGFLSVLYFAPCFLSLTMFSHALGTQTMLQWDKCIQF